jgi:hypothetical protein
MRAGQGETRSQPVLALGAHLRKPPLPTAPLGRCSSPDISHTLPSRVSGMSPLFSCFRAFLPSCPPSCP